MQSDQSNRATWIVFFVLGVAILIASILVIQSRPAPVEIVIQPPLPTLTPAPTHTPEPILVYITGAIMKPDQTLTMPYGSHVQDAIEEAGGLLDDADQERVNLAAILHDGDQIHVPYQGEAENQSETILPTPSGGVLVYINTASLEELQTLPGVGPSLAQRILDDREANGSFASLEDLDRVSGIGPSTLENLADLISFE